MSLSTSVICEARNMVPTVECSVCHAAEDLWRHSLFECHMSRCVWALGDEEILKHVISNRIDDARLQLFYLFDMLQQHELA